MKHLSVRRPLTVRRAVFAWDVKIKVRLLLIRVTAILVADVGNNEMSNVTPSAWLTVAVLYFNIQCMESARCFVLVRNENETSQMYAKTDSKTNLHNSMKRFVFAHELNDNEN